ncbi:MAG TPA: DUF459 domain-containing protein [Thermoleophilia bacterium]|nr:DUF459 domain-containing protein [Thermoleophilia bacterium]
MAGDQTPRDERSGGTDPGDERRRSGLPFGRRRRTAASALVAMLVALALGALLNAPAMQKTALALPFGAERSFRLALVDPLATVSHWLFLDRPAKLTAVALGKPDPGPTGTSVVVVRPTPGPTAGGKPGDDGDKPRKTLQERALPKPYKGHPMHLYIAGDSMLGLPGMALTNLSIKTRLIKPLLDYRISTGLVRPDAFNWPAQLQRQVRAFRPGAVAVMFGANDNQPLQAASGEIHQFGSDGWKREYRRRVQDVVGLLFQNGVRRVYWIGQPVMPEASFNGQIRLMNEIYRGVAEQTFGVRYIDAYSLLADGRGEYAQYLPDEHGELQQVREQDGEHLTYAGGLRIAGAVLDEIGREWLPKKGEGDEPPPGPGASATPAP